MVVMPLVGVAACLAMEHTLGDKGLGVLRLERPYDEVLYLAAAAVTATPTANTLVVMVELAGGDRAAMSTAIFSQYCAAPLVLTVSLTCTVLLLHLYG